MLSTINGGGGSQGDVISDLKRWFLTCGFFTKHLTYACLAIFVLNMLTGIGYYLANVPAAVVGGVQIWRLFTSPFVSTGIIQLVFGFWAFLPACSRLEQEVGTIKTFVDFVLKNLFINVTFIMMCYLLGFLFSIFTMLPCYGLWQIYFVLLVGRCLQDPEGVSMLLCLPVQIKNKFYPIALFLLFSVLGGMIAFDSLAAMLYGYFHHKYLEEKYQAFLNTNRISAWENASVFAWLKDQANYIDPSGAVHNGAQLNDLERASQNLPGQAPQPAFNAFSGRGIAIQETEEPKKQKKDDYVHLGDDSGDFENPGR